ncbi:MAG: hypothetical protein L3J47_00450 [Sulfurovum sp.]|nr:hypothetical protein [Sulfurovum sp.]
MCKAWKDDFAAFFKDMGLKPTKKHSLDRIDADGDYGPSNCKWSTMKEQNRNKRNSRGIVLTIDGVDMNVWDAMELFGTTVSYPAVVGRLKRGWDHKEAVTYDARKAHSGAAVRKKVDRSTVVLLIVGKTMSIKDAVSHFGNVVSYASALGRIRRGWDHKKAVSTPTRKKRENKA